MITDLRLHLRFKLYYPDNHHYQLSTIHYLISNIYYLLSSVSVLGVQAVLPLPGHQQQQRQTLQRQLQRHGISTSPSSPTTTTTSASQQRDAVHLQECQVRCRRQQITVRDGTVRFGRFSHGEIRFSVKTLKLTIVGTCTSF